MFPKGADLALAEDASVVCDVLTACSNHLLHVPHLSSLKVSCFDDPSFLKASIVSSSSVGRRVFTLLLFWYFARTASASAFVGFDASFFDDPNASIFVDFDVAVFRTFLFEVFEPFLFNVFFFKVFRAFHFGVTAVSSTDV